MFLYQSAKFLSEKPFVASFIMFSVCKKSIILYRMPSCRYQNGILFLQTSWNTPQMPQASRTFVVKVARRAVHDKNKCESVSGNAVLAFRNRVVLRTSWSRTLSVLVKVFARLGQGVQTSWSRCSEDTVVSASDEGFWCDKNAHCCYKLAFS